MNEKLWNEFVEGKAAINCKSENEAREFLKLCEEKNINWCTGEKATSLTKWYKENTCYTKQFKNLGIQYFTLADCKFQDYKIINYTKLMETMEENKKTFTGTKLAQMMINGETKAGMKFISDTELEYKIVDYDTKQQDGIVQVLYRDKENKMATNGELVYRTFTLIEEPKLIFLNQVGGRKIKLKHWALYYFAKEAIISLGLEDKETIQDALTKQIWEVEA